MKQRTYLVFGSIVILFVVQTVAQAQISVGPIVHVSRSRADVSHLEVLMAADPGDMQKLVGCSMIGPTPDGKIRTGAYVTFDGGLSWTSAVTDDSQMVSADPACTFGIANQEYFASLSRGKDLITRLNVYYSQDGGRTWGESRIPEGARHHIDREYVTVDTTRSRFRGRIYIHAMALGSSLGSTTPLKGIALFRSLDGGKTFELPVKRLLPDRTTTLHPGNAVVLSDGTLVALFAQLVLDKRNDGYVKADPAPASRPNGFLQVIASSDGGESLDQEVQVSDIYADWRLHASTIPSLAADVHSKAFRDRLYAVWADGRFGGRSQIVLSHSTDKGKTWSKPRLVSDDRAPVLGNLERPAALPVVAVNKDGVVGISWLDRRSSPDDVDYQVRFAASLDGGETFLPSVAVSEQLGDINDVERWVLNGVTQNARENPARLVLVCQPEMHPGDTGGLAADAKGMFHPLWIGLRNGIRQVWTAPVTVKGQVIKHGDQSAAKLDDVTSRVDLDVVDASYDRTTNEGTLNIRLKNISKDTIVGPIKLRALMVTSELGVAHILNADNRLNSDGAIWDYTSMLGNNLLPPGGTSGVKSLKFRITDLRPFRQANGSYKWIFADVSAIVLGTVQATESTGTRLP